MKKLFFGVIATVMFSFSGFAATNIEKDKAKPSTNVTVTAKKATKKLVEESCTVCITISIAGSGGSQCATAATCSRARTLVAS
jgi:hypothetical protein